MSIAQNLMPAWSLPRAAADEIGLANLLPERVDREWAIGGSTGKGVRVCILDSGVERGHPLVGDVAEAVAIEITDGVASVTVDEEGDLTGHGTACASIVRAIAPDAQLYSARVLGANSKGSTTALLAGLEWAVSQQFDIVNMSLSTTKKEIGEALHELADSAYFKRMLLVAAAHNMPVESYPWRFSSVVSVGSHEEPDPLVFYANPSPPVEFFAHGVNVDIAWLAGGSLRASGNSFATPAIAGIAALLLGKHPGLRPFEVKTVLSLIADNVQAP